MSSSSDNSQASDRSAVGGAGVHGVLPSEVRDHPLIAIAGDLSAIAWTQMQSWRSSLGSGLDSEVVDTKTSANDLVTEADAQIEALVRGYLSVVRPRDLVVGEEGSAALDPAEFFDDAFLRTLSHYDSAAGALVEELADAGSGQGVPAADPQRLEWHVDPIDGTVNYVRGIEHFAFSVGVCLPGASGESGIAGDWLIGLVASPGLGRTWLAAAGFGAFGLDGLLGDHSSAEPMPAKRLRGTPSGLSGRILATGFAYKGDNRNRQLSKLSDLMENFDDLRRCGSAAVDLCMVAEGKVNCYAERGLGVYDYAGGALIAEESGAFVRRGGPGGATVAADSQAELERLLSII